MIFRNNGLNMPVQQKIKAEFLLKRLGLILYPSKHGDRYPKITLTPCIVTEILTKGFFITSVLICILGGLPKDDSGIIQVLKSTLRRFRNSRKIVRTVLHACRSLPPDYNS